MALVKFLDNKDEVVAPEVAHEIWKVLNSDIEGTKEQQQYCKNINKIYLNWRHPDCPDSYIKFNLASIIPVALNDWMVDPRTGKSTRPDPANPASLKFAKRWGMWEHGPSELVTSRNARIKLL